MKGWGLKDWAWEMLRPVILVTVLTLIAASCAQMVERSEPEVVQQENCK